MLGKHQPCKGAIAMNMDMKLLVEQIEGLTRSDFRASVNPTRRATLAVGAIILHWGSLIEWMGERHKCLGLGGLPNEHPSDQAGRLTLLRRFIKACSADASHLRDFDRLRQQISRATAIRDDLVHGALGLGNPTGDGRWDFHRVCALSEAEEIQGRYLAGAP
jgi:hypothetical protein